MPTFPGRRAPLPLAVAAAAGLLLGLLVGVADNGPQTAIGATSDPVVAVAGDIGVSGPTDTATAALVERIGPDLVLTTGDNAYGDGTQANYQAHYDPDWGRFKAITRPSPGNHDYHAEAGDPPYYYTYFADQLPAANGGRFYATDIGTWRLYSLNCEIDCSATSAQVAWLRQDLATNGAGKNKLAYLHRPRYSCGANHGSESRPVALWQELIAARADLVLAAHDHNYQRFPRMDTAGNLAADGLASFVVGTGGNGLYPLGSGQLGCAHVEYAQGTAHGVLKLTLGADQYSWDFVAVDGTVMDSGSAATLAGTPTQTPTGRTKTSTATPSASPTTPAPTPTTSTTSTTTATPTPLTTTSSPAPPLPTGAALAVPLAASSDDAEERAGGEVALASSDLELVTDGSRVQTVGLRFAGVAVPPGATVTSAFVQLQTDEVSTGAASLTVQGLAADDTPTFSSAAGDVSGRERTGLGVAWAPPEWTAVGARGFDQQTPDLAPVVQEIVDRPGWSAGNALGLVVSGDGRRAAESVDGAAAPVLHLAYTTGPAPNGAPLVDAGPDRTVTDGDPAVLDGTVTDDGLPGAAALGTTWSVDTGAAGVAFADAAAADTTAAFPGPGNYLLRLTAHDSELSSSDTVLVTVLAAASPRSLDVAVAAGSDDAEELVGGSTRLGSLDLEMAEDTGRAQVVGLRFVGVAVPPGARITAAYVQLQVDEVSTGPASLSVHGEAADDAAPFTSAAGDVSGRAATVAVPWAPPDWGAPGAAGPEQRTPDLSAVVQEIVDRPGWVTGNALVLVVSGTGTRTAESRDGAAAPALHVEYTG